MPGNLPILMPKHPPETVITDTNIWISSLFYDENQHYESLRKIHLYEIQNYIVYLPQPIIFEIITVMRRANYPRHLIQKFVDKLLNYSKYRIIVINFEELCQLGISYPQRISLKSVDYQFLLYCVKFKPDKIETYDKQLSKHIQASQNNEKTE